MFAQCWEVLPDSKCERACICKNYMYSGMRDFICDLGAFSFLLIFVYSWDFILQGTCSSFNNLESIEQIIKAVLLG